VLVPEADAVDVPSASPAPPASPREAPAKASGQDSVFHEPHEG